MESVGQCKLCGTPNLNDKNFELIDVFIKQVFDVILPKLSFDDTTQELICEICLSKLLEAFNFKYTCLDTEDIIFPYVNSETSKAIDLKDIYAKEKIHKQESETLKDWEICRLCFQPVSSKTRDIQDVPQEIIQIYIPEIKFAVTTNASICTKCFESLYVHSNFIKSYSAIEDKTNMYAEDTLLTNSCIKTEEIEIKSEATDEEETFFEILPKVVKKEEIEEGTFIKSYSAIEDKTNMFAEDTLLTNSCIKTEEIEIKSEATAEEETFFEILPKVVKKEEIEEGTFIKTIEDKTNTFAEGILLTNSCIKTEEIEIKSDETVEGETFFEILPNVIKQEETEEGYTSLQSQGDLRNTEDTYECSFENHENDLSQVKTYKCDKFQTKTKSKLVRHQPVHEKPSEVKMFKCGKCKYESKHKRYLTRHQLVHKDSLGQIMFKCDKCSYESKCKNYLVKHVFIHRDPSEGEMFKCDKCKYESRYKRSLEGHQLVHRDPSELQMYKCDKCKFESKYKKGLERHQLTHMEPSELHMHKCDKCTYETKSKYNLKQHQLIHKDASAIKMFNCDKCNYESKWKSHLWRHKQLVHRDPLELHKCDKCKNTSVLKRNLLRRQLVHKNPTEVEMFKCDECKYKTKHQGSSVAT